MKLEQQQVSFELSKELKKAGYPQEGLWWWIYHKLDGKWRIGKGIFNSVAPHEIIECVAPTVAELGEKLPSSIECKSDRGTKYFIYLEMDKHIDQRNRGYRFRLRYRPKYNEEMRNYHNDEYRADTEANARAKMWLYLKKGGLL